ncbi:hypothetical protein G5V59_22430 [Nocardioides sp. W3-2-3]|uniref:hypothetical protein n=1 Tax=Nocardioides convexus TaxID=2712224 RepID=UPI0024188E8E|nr:hypothetical protein [Nocardioides convexus]NHA01597.1 hypothetical protein [Nocardioides convexus]
MYRTRDHQGRPTTASGLVVLPDGRRGALRVAAYLHGTNATRSAAATVSADSTDRLIAAMFAGAGMAAVAPDYLGLGLGPGSPPYLDLATEVGSTTDLLEAARAFVRTRGVVLRREVMVTGFSQGGRTSLAVGRALQQGEAGWFRLGGVSAVAGPYDVLGTELPAVFRGEVPAETAVYYLAYLVTAWDRTVGLYDDPRDAFQPAYAEVVEGWFDGSHTYEGARAAAAAPAHRPLHPSVPGRACGTRPGSSAGHWPRVTGSAATGRPGSPSPSTPAPPTPMSCRPTPRPALAT